MFPELSTELISQVLFEQWGIQGHLDPLPGEFDLNLKLSTSEGIKLLVKVSDSPYTDEIDFQIKAIQHISSQDRKPSFQLVEIIETIHGHSYHEKQIKGRPFVFRILTWVEGKLFVHSFPKSNDILMDLGRKTGEHLRLLSSFEHPSSHRQNFKWDLANVLAIEEDLHYVSEDIQGYISQFLQNFKRNQEIYDRLPRAVIHNDFNDYNILVKGGNISGFIDYGDMCYTQRINDLAIVLAYVMLDKVDPLEAAFQVIKGYVTEVALSYEEIECLFTLAALRSCTSIVYASKNLKTHPENQYLQVSMRPAIDLIRKLSAVSPSFAFRKFLSATPQKVKSDHFFKEWTTVNKDSWSQVCAIDVEGKDYLVLDLSVGSEELGHEVDFNDPYVHDAKVAKLLKEQEKSFAIGKYNEVRPLYSSDDFTQEGNEGQRWRTVHLGLDFFGSVESEVYAFLDGTVYAVKYNEGAKNYGNTIILKHETDLGAFYTLYGHLSSKSLIHLRKGQIVKRGQCIGWFGDPEVNGNWAPHLHFQIILDMLNYEDDFPGVCYYNERSIFTQISPDPSPLLGIEIIENDQLEKEEILAKRKESLGRSYSISYSEHLHIVRAHMQYLYDTSGRKYLDCVNNVPHVGHQNFQVIQAAQRQMALLNTNTRYLHEKIVQLSERLTSILPDSLAVSHFVNSGSEANELAIRIARTSTGRKDIVVMEHGYHGNTNLNVDMSSYKFHGKGGMGKKDFIHIIEMPEPFRGKYKGNEMASRYAQEAIDHIDKIAEDRGYPAAFICESILSCGGQLCFPSGYLKSIYQAFKERGIVIIADEVQTGLGRIGSHHWAFESEGVLPDIVTIGKPFGNGHPLGGVVCTEELADLFANGMEYFNTFGGNPVSCAIGLQVLKIVEEEQLMQNALSVGNYVKAGFEELKKKHPIIGDVRGHGFFLGWEFILNEDWTPADEQASYFANRMKEMGVLLSTDGPLHNVIKFKPPMIFSKLNADYMLECAAKVLKEDLMQVQCH